MTTKRQPANDELNIASYLKTHPDFFDRHIDLLENIQLSHPTGASVSLIERQVSLLRDHNRSLKKQLGELMDIARDNDRLNAAMHELTLRLVKSSSLRGVFQAIDLHFNIHFKQERYVTVLLRGAVGVNTPLESNDVLRISDESEPGFDHIAGLLKESRPLCNRVSEAQLSMLFGAKNDLRSTALIPLRSHVHRGPAQVLGFICVASTDPSRFHPTMGTLFLTHMGETVSCAIERHLPSF